MAVQAHQRQTQSPGLIQPPSFFFFSLQEIIDFHAFILTGLGRNETAVKWLHSFSITYRVCTHRWQFGSQSVIVRITRDPHVAAGHQKDTCVSPFWENVG